LQVHAAHQSQQKSLSALLHAKEEKGQNSRERKSSDSQTHYDRSREGTAITIGLHTIYRAGNDELKLGESPVIEVNNPTRQEVNLHFDSTTNRLRQ